MSSTKAVTIGVPVYRGEAFLAETLRSIQQQTHRDFVALISVDGADPASEAVCQPFLQDSRFQLTVQPARLGWVGNLNWLMAHTETPYWCYHQQDDLMDATYLATLTDFADRTPEAAVVYCDIEAFGTWAATMHQPSVTGSVSARMLALLYEHLPAVAFRGVTRVEALRLSNGIPPNEMDSFACDTAWMAAMVRSGELRRVPVVLYRKRYHAANEHAKWFTWPLDRLKKAWAMHCAAMLEQATLIEASLTERRLLWLTAAHRLFSPRTAGLYLPVASFTVEDRAALLDSFRESVMARGLDIPCWLNAGWEEIRQWHNAFVIQAD